MANRYFGIMVTSNNATLLRFYQRHECVKFRSNVVVSFEDMTVKSLA